MKSLLHFTGLIALATSLVAVSASPSGLYDETTIPRFSKREPEALSADDERVLRRALERREFTLLQGEQEVLNSYDYVIAGGGLAGLVLASRLSEEP